MKMWRQFRRQWRSRESFRRFRWPKILTFKFYWSIIAAPFVWLKNTWKQRRFQDLLLGLPALAGILGLPVLVAQLQQQEKVLSATYLSDARRALAAEQYGRAELLLTRVLQRGDSALSEAQYTMAVLLEETNQLERASELFRILAPDDQRGNREAHRRLAIIQANEINNQSDPQQLKRLHWHLTATGQDGSAAIAMAWGRYYLVSGDYRSAKARFEQAVEQFPELWQTLGELETRNGQTATAVSAYRRSSEYLAKRLQDDPENAKARVDYAQVLMRLGDLDQAQRVLEQGRLMNPEGPWPWLLASLAVNFHDLRSTQGVAISELLGYLNRALNYEPNHGPALNRLMSYATAKVEGNAELRTVLARVIAEGKEPGLAHLAMGNLCWLEGKSEQAILHFDMAMQIREDVPVLLNNMAWLIAHDEQKPDPERALALVNAALEKRPENASFLDTRGTIYIMQEKWRLALTDLEQSLNGVRDKKSVHVKLANVYDQLKLPEIAQQHRLLAESLAANDSTPTALPPRAP